jgi:hypothetical protein
VRLRCLLGAVLACTTAACGSEDHGITQPTSSTTQPTSPSGSLLSVTFESPAVNGGVTTSATVTLNAPVRTTTSIGLVSDNPAAPVPPFVMVPAGSATAAFPVATRAVPSDTYVTIIASLGDGSVRTTLAVRRNAPSSFSYTISPTRAGGVDAVGRYTSDDTTYFRASCDGNGIYVEWSGQGNRWELAMWGMPMRPGAFDVLPGLDAPPPRLRISAPPMFNGLSYNCSDGKASVVVEETEVRQNGDVERFVATIDQQCAIRSDRIHAEIMLTRPPQLGGGTSPASCIP